MADIAKIVNSLGGMAQKQQLVARGAHDLELTRAVRSGSVMRARQGWYTTLPEQDPRVLAVRVGGRLTGISALIAAGAWVRGRFPLHVSVHDNAARLRSPWNRFLRWDKAGTPAVVLHWDDPFVARRGTATSVHLLDALLRVVLDERVETAVAALDWALSTNRIDRIDFERLVMQLPAELRPINRIVDDRCGSIPESEARVALLARGHSLRSQVPVAHTKQIDLVVDEEVGLEVDGKEHHRDRFESDRAKDLDITLAGMHAIRPSAQMVFHDWQRVLAGIEIAIAARTGSPFGNSGPQPVNPVLKPGFPRRRRRRTPRVPEFPQQRARDAAAPAPRGPG